MINKLVKKYYIKSIIIIASSTCLMILFSVLTYIESGFNVGFIIVWGIYLMHLINKIIYLIKKYHKLKALIIKNKEIYENELNGKVINIKGNFIFSEKLVFIFDHKIDICTYDDLILMYKKTYAEHVGGIRTSLFFRTKSDEYEILLHYVLGNSERINVDLEKLILEKNPHILIGKTKENRETLKQKYNIKI